MLENSNFEGPSPLKPIFRPPVLMAVLATITAGGVGAYTVQRTRNSNAEAVKKQPIPVVQVKTVTALGRLEPKGEIIKLSAPASAEGSRVEKLLVREGTKINEGQIVAILDSRDRLAAALAEAQEQVRVAQANLAQVKAGAKQGEIEAQKAAIARIQAEQDTEIPAQQATIARLEAERDTEIEAQQATIGQLEAQLNNALAEYRRYQTLYQQGAISASFQDTKRLTLTTAQKQIAQARANLKRIQTSREQQIAEARANLKRIQTSREQEIAEGRATLNKIAEVRSVDVEAAQAEVNRAKAAVKRAEANLRQAFVRSPEEGQVLKINTRPGELVSTTDGIAEIGQTSQMYAVAEVYQSDINKVRLGQRVRLQNESLPDQLVGTVDRLGMQVQRQNVINSDPTSNIDSRVVEVHVRLDEPSSQNAARFSNLQVRAVIEL
ncbi:heterocyst specific ABC-transporter, membrane fusion protein DevB homolog [Scytonema sp. HK-05]|uniref:HlyD family efflux transporter periplasmic adaptor subunit n=1 Tax=Scytonema sp. HK-05 TaxID=1137095 RepID=UPI000937A0F8|nr:HlyD family efflux transporter periplasmic adaptor subunit [Scytonema sp. HK-05]OKH56731.1 HlyD family secretion protein [Scytonema sp. HK-05]BAY49222.1 heterocyst specific ABC-transporter, membrane fusion protein DevB homolog [Scytonema sp. HK-05]